MTRLTFWARCCIVLILASVLSVGCSKKKEVALLSESNNADGEKVDVAVPKATTPVSTENATPQATGEKEATTASEAPAAPKNSYNPAGASMQNYGPPASSTPNYGASYNPSGTSSAGYGPGSSATPNYGSNYNAGTSSGPPPGQNANYSPTGAGSQSGPQVVAPKTLKERAEAAFASGNDSTAIKLIQASAIANPSEMKDLVSQVRWASARNVPKIATRIAVGVDGKIPEGLTDVKPIGSTQQGVGGNGGSGGNKSGYGGGSSGPPAGYGASSQSSGYSGGSGPAKTGPSLEALAGTMGDVLVESVRALHEEGKIAPVFKSNLGVRAKTANGAAPSGYNGGSGGYPGGGSSYSPSGSGNGQQADTANKDSDDPAITSLAPGLGFIGLGDTASLVKKAKKLGFDSLVVYEVAVSVNRRTGIIGNECKAKLISLGDGKTIASSKSLKNTDVQKDVQKGENNVVEKAMQPILSKLGEKVGLNDIPSVVTAEIVQSKRMPKLVSNASGNPIDAVIEVKYYESLGYLDEKQVAEALTQIVGEEAATKLKDGTEPERLKIAEDLIKKA